MLSNEKQTVVKIILTQKVMLHKKIGFNSCERIKFLNITNFHVFHVWSKRILKLQWYNIFPSLFFLFLILQRNFFPLRLRHQTSATKLCLLQATLWCHQQNNKYLKLSNFSFWIETTRLSASVECLNSSPA